MTSTPRGNVNTQGTTPLANTSSGAAGTVTGTERSKLQGILAGASRLATAVLDGLLAAADKAKLDTLLNGSAAATASTTALRDGSGYLTAQYFNAVSNENLASQPPTLVGRTNDGYYRTYQPGSLTAGAALALAAGNADGDKLHNLGNALAAQATIGTVFVSSQQTFATIALPAGTWLIFGNLDVYIGTGSGTARGQANLAADGYGYLMSAAASVADGGTMNIVCPPVVISGGRNVYLQGTKIAGTPSMYISGDGTSYLLAVRIG